MQEYKTLQQIYDFFGYTPPAGSMDYPANVGVIFNYLLVKAPDARLLDNRSKKVNELLKEGFDFRGIKIRIK